MGTIIMFPIGDALKKVKQKLGLIPPDPPPEAPKVSPEVTLTPKMQTDMGLREPVWVPDPHAEKLLKLTLEMLRKKEGEE